MKNRKVKSISKKEIKEELLAHYSYAKDERELAEEKIKTRNGETGAIMFSINGSPPKGYVIYTPELKRVSFYNLQGKWFRILENTILEGVER